MRWAHRITVGVLAVGVLWGLPVVAAAQGASPLADARLSEVRPVLETTLAAAENEGLPTQPLVEKMREGLAKHVPPPRIAAAVQMLLDQLRSANHLLSAVPASAKVPHDRLVEAGAEALMAGADPHALSELISALTRSAHGQAAAPLVEEALVVVAELGERGLDGRLAATSVRTAFRTQGRRGWDNLLRSVRALGPGASPAEQARAVERAAETPGRGAPGFVGNPHGGGAQGKAKAKGH